MQVVTGFLYAQRARQGKQGAILVTTQRQECSEGLSRCQLITWWDTKRLAKGVAAERDVVTGN